MIDYECQSSEHICQFVYFRVIIERHHNSFTHEVILDSQEGLHKETPESYITSDTDYSEAFTHYRESIVNVTADVINRGLYEASLEA